MNGSLEELSEDGLWQVVEFADYTADLPLWTELAAQTEGSVLDLGCGVGRVAHHLAGCGAEVLGIDSDPGLVADFSRLASAAAVPATATAARSRTGASTEASVRRVACAELVDATRLADPEAAGEDWKGRRFQLILAPQQFLQLFDEAGRLAVLRGVRKLIAPDGIAAFAICEELPEASIHFPGVMPDARESLGWYYSSMPVAIEPGDGFVVSSRRRDRVSPEGRLHRDDDEVRIYRLDRSWLEHDLLASGLDPYRIEQIPQTERHMGSTAVIARPVAASRPVGVSRRA